MNKAVRILKARKKLHEIMEKKRYKSIGGTLWTTIVLMALLWVGFGVGVFVFTEPEKQQENWRMVWPWLSLSTAIVGFAVMWTKLQRVK